MVVTRVQVIVAAVMLAVGAALVLWTVVGDHGIRWGVFGSVLIGFAAVEAYVATLDEQQRAPIRGWLYLLTPLLSGGIFAAALVQERPDPVPGDIAARGGSAVGFYGGGALTWSWDGLIRTTDSDARTLGGDGSFFDPPVLATEEVVIDGRGEIVRAFDPVTGAERWSRRISHLDAFRRYDDLLVYDSNGHTAALEIATGEDRWRRPGGPSLANGGLIVTGTDSWWDFNFTSGTPGLIEQDRYVGIRDQTTYRRLAIVEVATGKVVRTESIAFQADPFALAGDFLYTADADADADGARATSLVADGPSRAVVMHPHDNSDDPQEPDRLFESRYPGFLGAMPDGWRFPPKTDVTIDRNVTGFPVFPVVSASGDQAAWFTGSSRVVGIEDAYDELLAYAYDTGIYLQLVADHDAVGTRVHRLDVVRGRTVTSYMVDLEPDAEPTLSVRDGLACVVGECRRVPG
ncbi:PQQ-binding-like beta-propeller repeat protein [Nocardioides albus]|uniref:PQQ-binding-like beta-propeller repeat protein n=1 Tax=Nocardioides albus TaxID=1841 RepID=A0A7W5A8Q3_9ACTN|nr:PQQ-binding-like beta-propeller repeat protein [Nocardioides albus]MBB3091627.1 hypothetical protein [Nocardioides albus]